MEPNVEVVTSDLLIIGGGIAGLVGAIKARELGVDVLVADKGGIGWAGQVPISGGRSLIMEPEDDVDEWVRWAVENGAYLNNQAWTYNFAKSIYGIIMDLVHWGMPITGEGGKLNVIPRMLAYKAIQFSAGKLMPQLASYASKVGVRLLNKIAVVDLISHDGEISGALGIGLTDQKAYLFKAKAFVIANGSCRYKRQKSFDMCTGEGIIMAYRAGAELMNAEFSNTYGFCSKGFEVFTRNPAYYFFVNTKGERILLKYFPELVDSLTSKRERQDFAKIVEAMAKEVHAGNGPIYLDLTNATQEEIDFALGKHLYTPYAKGGSVISDLWNTLEKKGVNGIKEKVEIIPMFVGGQGPLRVDLDSKTTVGRLWAAGDASSLGCGWMGSRSSGTFPSLGIPFALVSGSQGGVYAGRFAKEAPELPIDNSKVKRRVEELLAPLKREKGYTHHDLSYKIHEAVVPMRLNFFRSADGIQEALAILGSAQEMLTQCVAKDTHQLVKISEADAMAISGEITYRAALMRTETRGTHRRMDFPERDDLSWLKWIIVQKKEGKMTLRAERVPLEKYRFQPK